MKEALVLDVVCFALAAVAAVAPFFIMAAKQELKPVRVKARRRS